MSLIRKMQNVHIDGKEDESSKNESSFVKTSYYNSGRLSQSASPTKLVPAETPLALIDFLAIAQWRNIDYMPITWQPALGAAGAGATALIHQSLVNLQVSCVFKRIHLEKVSAEGRQASMLALMSEVTVLGHPVIRQHGNIIRLEGICWEFRADDVWPVLVFKKTPHGDLRRFMRSVAGRLIKFEDRLRLCSDIAAAVMTMHSFHVIHGDLKPENVLIFEEEPGKYVAKVADFGYSTLSLNRAEDDEIQLPRSRPWNAPEVTEWKVTFSFGEARTADAYSFGMLCLWLLFENKVSDNPFDADAKGKRIGNDDLKWLEKLKQDGDLQSFARARVDETNNLDQDQKEGLKSFFKWTLTNDPIRRQLSKEKLANSKSMFWQQRRAKESDGGNHTSDPMPSVDTVNNLGILYRDIEGILQSFGHHHYYRIPSMDLGYESDRTNFQLTKSFPQITAADYRLWGHIQHCFEYRAVHGAGDWSSSESAFQLAFYFKVGLGISRDDDQSAEWLEKSGKSQTDLEVEINRIKGIDGIFFESKSIPIDLVNFADEYRQSGILRDAEKAYDITSGNMECLFGSSHPTVVRLRLTLTEILKASGHLREAETLLLKMVDIYEKSLGTNNQNMIAAQSNLGSVYIDQGQWRKAEQLQLKVLEKCRRTLGEEDRIALISMTNLGVTYWNQGQWKKAEELQVQELELLRKIRGPEHRSTLTTMNNLASNYERQGRLEEAEKLKSQVLEISSRVFGKGDPHTLAIMGNLANNFRLQKRWRESENLEVQVLEARKRDFGTGHPITLKSMGNLASTYAMQGRLSEAEKLEIYVAQTAIRQLGSEHPDALTARNNLAHTLKGQGRAKEAIDMMSEVARLREKVLGREHPETARSTRNLDAWRATL